jgi:hypothetical protein
MRIILYNDMQVQIEQESSKVKLRIDSVQALVVGFDFKIQNCETIRVQLELERHKIVTT